MKTNEVIFSEIKEQGFITKSQIQLLKSRSNRDGKDVFDYALLDEINDGYGIPVTSEQGAQGLAWLLKFIKKDVYGYRERDIISNASASDFTFRGFYDAGNGWGRCFVPIYDLNGMEYVPLSEPYIIG